MQWIILALAMSVVAACPKDIMGEVERCMSALEGYSGNGGGLFMLSSPVETTSKWCKDGKIQEAFSCLNKIYTRCAKTREGARQLDLWLDVDKWRQAIETICDNIYYLQDHAACEALAYQEYQPCAEKETIVFTDQVADLRAQMNSPQYITENQKFEAFLDVTCAFSVKIQDCLRNPYERFCPQAMTNLVVDTVQNMMPPACARRALTRSFDLFPKYNYDDGLKAYDKSNDNNNNNNKNDNSNNRDDGDFIRKEIVIENTLTDEDRYHNNGQGSSDENGYEINSSNNKGGDAARSSSKDDGNGGDRFDASQLVLIIASILGFLMHSHVGI